MSLESGLRVLLLWTLLCAALLKGGATAKTRVVSSGGIQMLLSGEDPNSVSGLLDPKLEPHPGVSPGNSFWKSGGASSADGILAVTNGQKDSSPHWPSVWLQNAGVQSISSREHQEKTSHALFPMGNAVKPGLKLKTRHQSANVLASSKRFKAGASQNPNIEGEKQSVWVKIKPLNVADERSSFSRGQEQRQYFSKYDNNAGLDVEYEVLRNGLWNQNQVVPRKKGETLLGHKNYANNAYSVHKYQIWPAQKAKEQISTDIFNSEREKAKMGKQRSLYWSRRQQSEPAKRENYDNFMNRLDELRKQSLESLSQNAKSPNADENHVQEMSLYERPGLELYHSSAQDQKLPWKPPVAAAMAQAENGRRLQSSVRNGQKEQGHEAKQSPKFITVPPLGKDYVVSGKQFFTNTGQQAQKMSPFQRSSKQGPQDASPSPSERPQKTVALPNRQTARQELTMQELPLKSTGLVDNSMDFLTHLQPSSSIQFPNNFRNDMYTSFGLPPNTDEERSHGSENGHVRLRHNQAPISSLKLSEDSESNVPNRHASRLQTASLPYTSRQPQQSQENGQTENAKFSSISGLLEESWRRNLNVPQLSRSSAQMSRLQAKEANLRINAGRVFPLSAMHQPQQSFSDLIPDEFQNGSSQRLKTAEAGQGNMKPSKQPVLYSSKKEQISNGFPGSSWLPNQFSLQRKLQDSDDRNEAFWKPELNTFGPNSEIRLKSPGLFLQQTFGYLPTSQTYGKVGVNPNYYKGLPIQKPPFHSQSLSTLTQKFKDNANTAYRNQFSHWVPNLPH